MAVLITLALAAAIGLVLELARPLIAALFERFYKEESLREAVRQTQVDVAEATKRADTLSGAAKAIRQEVARAKEAQAELEKEFENLKKVEPVLVFPIGAPNDEEVGGRRRFRAPITKTLQNGADVNQTQIWGRHCFVEVCCYSAAEAKIEAYLQFPPAHGYAIGPLTAKSSEPVETEPVAGEAA